RAYHLVMTDQRIVYRRLLLKDIQRGSGYLAAFERIIQVLLINDPAPGAINNVNAVFHRFDGFRPDKILCLVGERRMNGDKIGAFYKLGDLYLLDAYFICLLFAEKGIKSNYLHTKALSPPGNLSANIAEPYNAERLVVKFCPHELLFFPLSICHRGACLRYLPGDRENHSNGVFCSGYRIAPGGIHDHYAAL